MPAETTSSAPVSTPALDLYPQWREPITSTRLARATIGSVIVHVVVITGFLSLPDVEPNTNATVITPTIRKVTPLYAPKFFEPTQKAPNNGKITRELDVRSSEPAPRPQAPHFRAPEPAPGPVAEAKAAAPVVEAPKIELPKPEPPKMEAAASLPPKPPAITPDPQPTPAPPATPAKPKLAFESISAGQSHSAPNPDSVVPDPRSHFSSAAAPVSGAGGTMVGDVGASRSNIPSSNTAPSPGHSGSNLQLLSDAKGVDFRPYLIQVLTVVRRNWLAILPESARLGIRGRVLIQFAIDRNGAVPKLVIAEGAGTDALDRAAVAAVSASYPFPPLPSEYKGDEIRLQFAFSYNMPTR
jgi:TonB family protein